MQGGTAWQQVVDSRNLMEIIPIGITSRLNKEKCQAMTAFSFGFSDFLDYWNPKKENVKIYI